MKVRLVSFLLLSLAAFVAAAAPAPAAAPKLTDSRYASILKYYDDCTWVARNAPAEDIAKIVGTLQQGGDPLGGKPALRFRQYVTTIIATRDVLLRIDPGIFAVISPTLPYDFEITPLSIVAGSNTEVHIQVKRQSVRQSADPSRPAVLQDGTVTAQFPPASPLVTTEVDDWVKLDGTWRLKDWHMYLVGGTP
jgi:hypothetical protein